jgi:hypothetical protein
MTEGIPQDVLDLFDQLADSIIAAGFDRYSARALLHRIRWHFKVEKGDREFKCNDHWTPRMARSWLLRHPERPNFFETRERHYSDTE